MKKTLSMLLAVLFVLTAFGATTVFGGVLGAGAVFYEYYAYTELPGFTAFTATEMADLVYSQSCQFANFDTTTFPGQTSANYTVTTPDGYGGASVGTFRLRNQAAAHNGYGRDLESPIWGANDAINGKTIFGDTGLTMEDANGFCFRVALNGQPFQGSIKLQVFQIPCQGPTYKFSEDGSTDMADMPVGFVYECDGIQPDEDGYVYYDFQTDFFQCDWWSVDDNGVNHYRPNDPNKYPIPESKIPLISGFQLRYNQVQSGDVLSIADLRIFKDTRIHPDELDEQIDVFDSLDPEAYTEESYAAAMEVYFRAYEMRMQLEEENDLTQKIVNAMVKELKAAIDDLDPMFKAREKSINIAGFEVWDDNDFEDMVSGGLCLDTPAVELDNVPANKDQSILVMANAQDGPPTYGWSLFTSSVDDGEIAAIKNPFELVGDSEPLSSASGIRFWLKWDESLDPIPYAMRIGLGSAAEGVYFECEDTAVELPESEGYVGVAWSNFYDIEGEADIYDYIDSLDYISIYIQEAIGIYYIADLQAFTWNITSADFAPLDKALEDAKAYMGTLTQSDWGRKCWQKVFARIDEAEALYGKYGVTDEDVAEAISNIQSAINDLVLRNNLILDETYDALEAAYKGGKTYWRGNVTAASYRDLMLILAETAPMLEKDITEELGQAQLKKVTDAIKNLVPIKAGEKVTSIHSFEDYSSREFNRATGDRTEGVVYSLDSSFAKLPAGYKQALKMTATKDMGSETTDEHGMMQFKAMYRDGKNSPVPILMEGSGSEAKNTLIGDLTGTDGLCLWVGVNDMNLVQTCTMRVAVSNCEIGPLFEMAAIDIPVPATGAGWIYLPWEYFEYYDEWTHGEPINLAKIFFYILRFDGAIKQGLEVYVTGIHAYKDTQPGSFTAPVIYNVTEGQEIDVSETPFIPDWDAGSAVLDGKYLIYGNPVVQNGAHTLTVTNGDKQTTVNFKTVGAVIDPTPVVTGVEDGGVYTGEVTIGWDVGEATLNGDPIETGKTVSEPGDYVLVVTNGNAEPVTIYFSISDKPPVKKGDFDGDGKITVTDALSALRIAAKLAPETPEAIAIGDIDGDGHVSVTDALAILRVAAKLVPSL